MATIYVYIHTDALECSGIFLSSHLLLHRLLNSIQGEKKKFHKHPEGNEEKNQKPQKNK